MGCKKVGVKKGKIGDKKEPWWKRRIESGNIQPEKDINRPERERREETGRKGNRKIKELDAKYRVKKKGANLGIEELKPRLISKEELSQKIEVQQKI